ncbi:hypothetical protein BDD12DRAFT_895937 [Trichophaea hybrida]|nr:hypothetical protein BDD12DRAFT_895937 [Trichophaea hybrida]
MSQDVTAGRIIQSTSLNPCMQNSLFAATLFNITFTPDDGLLRIKVNGISSLSGNVTAKLQIIAYGYTAMERNLNPCAMQGFEGMCPMSTGQITLNSNVAVGQNVANSVPGIAYQVPDLDGLARIIVNSTDTGAMVACVEAPLSNGKTVDQHGVGWVTAIIAGMGLIASAVTSGLGHSNTAAHVAANAVSLFAYFQSQAMIGMTAVKLPPIVSAWTQNFDWTMGIIEIQFMQDIFHWYIQATGGKPSNLLDRLSEVSVQIQKRSFDGEIPYLMTRAAMYGFEPVDLDISSQPARQSDIYSRSNNDNAATAQAEIISVSGIERVSFKAKIEATNFFMTGIAFFVAFLFFTGLGVCAFKGFTELAIKMKWIRGTKFQDFRNGWLTVLKGIMYRLVLIGFPQIAILCLWELTVHDSAGAMALAVCFFLSILGILGYASWKVIYIARRSVSLHKNPAYILYSDPAALNRWGFLYVQFRASAYYFIVPLLLYYLVKAMFVAFGQKNGTVQAFALLFIELLYLVAVSMMRPWMDKRTNIFNISICAINFLNVVFLLVFTGIFNSKDIVTGVMGVIFFVMNAAFALVLLILVLVSSVYALVSKNPDIRYQPMRDDRGSFIKSNSQMFPSTELDALGATARGDMKSRDLGDDDSDSYTHSYRPHHDPSQVPLPPSTANSTQAPSHFDAPRSPVDTSVPLFPSNGHDASRQAYAGGQQAGGMALLTPGGPRSPNRTGASSPSPSQRSFDSHGRPPPRHDGGYQPQVYQPASQQSQANW